MEYIEYPKMLYRDGAHRIVDDAEQESAARAERYDDWSEDQARLNVPAGADVDEAPDRDALKARAAELGIEHAPNIKTDKLAALVAAVEG